MRKYYLMAAIAVVVSMMATFMCVSGNVTENLKMIMNQSVEVLGKNEVSEGTRPVVIVTCHCNALLGHTCRANHNGATCAGGGNVQCSSYDGNC